MNLREEAISIFNLSIFLITLMSEFPSIVHSYTYKSFGERTTCTSVSPPVTPRTLPDLQNIISSALVNGQKVKAIGQLHSTSDCICTDGIPVDMSRINHFSYNSETTLATVGAGLRLELFQRNLHKEGRALTGAPAFGDLSVGGMIATGAHGTSSHIPSALSDQLVSVQIVDGLGKVREVTEEDELFKAVKVNLGLLGIVYEAVFRTVPQFKLQIRHFPLPDDILWNSTKLEGYADNNEWFAFWWFPSARQVVLSVGNRVGLDSPGTCESHLMTEVDLPLSTALLVTHEAFQSHRDRVGYFLIQQLTILGLSSQAPLPGRTPVFTEEDGFTICGIGQTPTGLSHKMMTNTCKNCYWKHGSKSFKIDGSFVLFPNEELLPALDTMRQVLSENPLEFTATGMFFRFITESDSYLGMNSGRATVELELASVPRIEKFRGRLGLPAVQAIGQALVEKHGGRPHWGVHARSYTSSDILQRAYPQLGKFVEAMNEMDPERVFMNNFGKRIRSEEGDAEKGKQKYCALNEDCVCESDSHCGNGGLLDLQCATLQGYKVCMDKPNFVMELAAAVSAHVINVLASINLSVTQLLRFLSGREELKDVSKLAYINL